MKRKVQIMLAAIMLCILGAGVSFGATINVPADHATIQAAINAASPGDVIQVAAGVYTENINIDRRISLIGAGSGSTVITQTAAGAGDPKIGVVQLSASGTSSNQILIQDLSIEVNGLAGISVGRFSEATSQNIEYITLENIIVDGTSPATGCGEQERGIYVDKTSSLSNLNINNCEFKELIYGWYFHKDFSTDASTVTNVLVSNSKFYSNVSKALYVEKLENASFTNCEIYDNGVIGWSGACTYFLPWLCGFDFNLKAGTYQNISIISCTYENNGTASMATNGAALMFKARGSSSDDTSYLSYPATLSNVSVSDCNFVDNRVAFRVGEVGKNNQSPSLVSINSCNFGGNTRGIENITTQNIDAENCWWNSNDGPSYASTSAGEWVVDASTGVTDFDPWLTKKVHNVTQNLWYNNIQPAIDEASAGDELNVHGTVNEPNQIVIDKSIKLYGFDANTSKVVHTGNTTAANYKPSDVWFLIEPGNNVKIKDLEFDGQAPGQITDWCICHMGYGFIKNCKFKNIKAGTYYGRAIVIFGHDINVENCVFNNIQRIGMHVRKGYDNFGSYTFSSAPNNINLIGNNYTGKGNGDWLDYGIEFGACATGSASNNTLTNCYGIADVDGSTSAGILATDYYGLGTDVEIKNNIIHHNSTGIYVGYGEGDNTEAVILENYLNDNGKNLIDNTGNDLDCSKNYWGFTGYTDVRNTIEFANTNGKTDFTPWLHSSSDEDTEESGFQINKDVVGVSSGSDQISGSRIDEAIDYVSNSIIHLTAGLYEPFTISKGVTLNGPALSTNNHENAVIWGNGALVTCATPDQSFLQNMVFVVRGEDHGNIGYVPSGVPSGYQGNTVFQECTFHRASDDYMAYEFPESFIETFSTCLSLEPEIRDGHHFSDGDGGTWTNCGPGKFFWTDPYCPPNENDLVLWLNPLLISSGKFLPVTVWPDDTQIKEDAVTPDSRKKPILSYAVGTGGIEGFPAVKFTTDYTNTGYGNSDIMVSPNDHTTGIGNSSPHDEITTGEDDKWNPDNTKAKNLFVVFQPLETNYSEPSTPYYSDERMCLFEAGGPLSGYNIYQENGDLVFGMWNRFQEKFIRFYPGNDDIYEHDKVYLAHLEYDNTNNRFRGIISVNDNGHSTVVSDWVDFAGISRDFTNDVTRDDASGVGGAARTCYHDYNTGETYSDNYNGKLADIMIYDAVWNTAGTQEVYAFLNQRYSGFGNGGFTYPGNSLKRGDWKIYEHSSLREGENQISDAYPNPFVSRTSFGLSLSQGQRVTVELFDSRGAKVLDVFSGELGQGMHDIYIDGEGLANGAYVFRVTGENFTTSGKVLLNR